MTPRRRPVALAVLLVGVSLTGCVVDAGFGPDLGACAVLPEGEYTFGEAGIGTCLSSPVDLQFLELGGRTWLVVANTDAYFSYRSGSVALYAWDSVDVDRPRNLTSELEASAVATPRFVGGMAHVSLPGIGAARDLLLVPTRQSAEEYGNDQLDELLLFELTDPSTPEPWPEVSSITVGQDPLDVVVEPDSALAYVLNVRDPSLSVLDVSTPDVAPFDVADNPGLTVLSEPATGAATVVDGAIDDPEVATNDRWTLTWLGPSWRLWLSDGEELGRWQATTERVFEGPGGPEISAVDLGLDRLPDAHHLLSPSDAAVAWLLVSDGASVLRTTARSPSTAWESELTEVLSAPSDIESLGVASTAEFDGTLFLAVEAEPTGAAAAARSIAVARFGTSDRFVWQGIALDPTGDVEELGQPWLHVDDPEGRVELYVGERVDGRWRLAVSAAAEPGLAGWSTPIPLVGLVGEQVGAPVVHADVGVRHLWYASADEGDATWTLRHATSTDGLAWTDTGLELPTVRPVDEAPPRPAAQFSGTPGFRVETDSRRIDVPTIAGSSLWFDNDRGVRFRPIVGHELAATGEVAAWWPSDVVALAGDSEPALAATRIGADGLRRPVLVGELGAGEVEEIEVGAPTEPVTDPVLFEVDGALELLVAAESEGGVPFIARAAEGLDGGALSPVIEPGPGWTSGGLVPGDVEVLGDGLRLWFSATNAGRTRIGTARSTDGGRTWAVEGEGDSPWVLGVGAPGTFDDTAVAHPHVVVLDGVRHLLYSGFDGDRWSIGHAIVDEDLAIVSRQRAGRAVPGTYAEDGVSRPVPLVGDDGRLTVWVAGEDTRLDDVTDALQRRHIGRYVAAGGTAPDPSRLEPDPDLPEVGDTLTLRVRTGTPGVDTIALDQLVEGVAVRGVGATGLIFDGEAGELLVPSRFVSWITRVDVRDDGPFDDNVFDVEGVFRTQTEPGGFGFRDVVVDVDRDRLYATGRRPDAVVVFDRAALRDDGDAEWVNDAVLGALPLRDVGFDAGASNEPVRADQSGSTPGGAGMALTSDGRLLVTHFRSNSLSVFDLTSGGLGRLEGYLDDVGENPYAVRVSPDGRHAVVAAYQGTVVDDTSRSHLAIVDLDRASPTYLQVVTRIVNQ